MHPIIQNIKNRYLQGTIVEKLIFINIGVFIIELIFGNLFGTLFGYSSQFLKDWFALPSNLSLLFTRPWSLVTFAFVHATNSFGHIFFNMLFLYWIGRLFIDFFIPKKLLNLYILGSLSGALVFLLVYNLLPKYEYQQGVLFGASAGIMAIAAAITTHIPNYQLNFRFIGNVKLWWITAFYILSDFLFISENTGGRLSHLGGALFGYFYIKSQSNFDLIHFFSALFSNRKPKMKATKTSKNKFRVKKRKYPTSESQDKVNKILEKISKSGYDSLSKSEKEYLFKQGK